MIRDVGFLSWKQETAWMEKMSGTRWNSMVKKENKRFKDSVKKVASSEELLAKSDEFLLDNGSMFFSHKNIILKYDANYEWCYVDSKKTYIVVDIAMNDLIYHIREVGHGAQKYRVECVHKGKVLWSRDNVGPQVALKDNICYVLGAEKLWYNSVIALDCKTGKGKIIYEETNKECNLSFVKQDGLFLIRENSGKQELYSIENDLHKIDSSGDYFYPLGYFKKKLCYLENVNNIWYAVGFPMKPFSHEIEYFSLKYGIYILRIYGLKVIYNLQGEELHSFYGNIYTHPFNDPKFFIDFTDSGIYEFSFEKPIKVCSVPFCDVTREFASSKDGTRVPYVLAKPFCEIKGLMVVSYGAYGIPTSLSTRRWNAYLRDGWMLCFAMVRGGGDVDRKWALSAQTTHKIRSYEDLEGCIKSVQKKYRISHSKTCIYGRSAGGYLVGIAVARSNLFKMVYTEVPYVDVLRTTTNSKLPLTQLEYNEFGNPAKEIYEFQEILKLSPVDSIIKSPDLFVIIHTSENDSQVYAYESYKWFHALGSAKKYIYLNEKKGHSISGSSAYENFSDDFFLLKSFRDV